jgi:Pyridoxamine 5'-phosphate oxidase
MGKVLPEIGDSEAAFIASQKVFFVATAPNSTDHHVNVSPKANGMIVLDRHTVAYADLTGSGAETAAHILQNGRMTIMCCQLEAGLPKILRLFGQATLLPKEVVPESLLKQFPESITKSHGFRAVFKLSVDRISSSCGYSLPIMTFERHRNTLEEYCERLGADGMKEYSTHKNSFSIDGLPSIGLLRTSEPVVPVVQDGYVLAVAADSAEKSSASSSNTIVVDIPRGHLFDPNRGYRHYAWMGAIGCAIFMAGFCSGRRSASVSFSN